MVCSHLSIGNTRCFGLDFERSRGTRNIFVVSSNHLLEALTKLYLPCEECFERP